MPLKRLKHPGESLKDYTGPKLDEFVQAKAIVQEPPKEVSHYINPAYRLEQEMKKRGFEKITKISQKNYFEKPIPNEAWKLRAWIVEPYGQIKTYGAYYSPDSRSSEFVGGGATFDEAIDALLKRLDEPQQ